jgi:hypothetical protein
MGEFTLRQLEYFVAVLDHGSLTKAASESNISQAAASMAIAQLEKGLGLDSSWVSVPGGSSGKRRSCRARWWVPMKRCEAGLPLAA